VSVLQLTACAVDLDREAIEREGERLRLTTREAELLRYLAARPGELVSREELLVEVWGYAPTVVTRAVDCLLTRLRKKIEVDPKEPDHLQTVYGSGYRLRTRVAPTATPTRAVPSAADVFIGRAEELLRLSELFGAGARLVTLRGPAGAGKSRLAMEYARQAEDDGQRVLVVRLEDATSPLQICIGVAGSLGMSVGSLAVQQIGRELSRLGPTLLVLDNLEQLLPLMSDTLGPWLEAAPEVRVLGTSRASLKLNGEHILPVEGLPMADARTLWQSRVRQVRPDYPDTDEESALLDALDRLPLALEMAASRMAVLSLEQLTGLLQSRFRLLVNTGAEGRQASMQAALQSSWERLEPVHQTAMVQLSVFRGGFTLDSADAVLALPDGTWTLDVLTALCERSMLSRSESSAGPRFSMFRSVVAFMEMQPADPDAPTRHVACFSRWAAPGWLDSVRMDPAPASVELENLLRAFEVAPSGDLARVIHAITGGIGPASLGLKCLRRAARVDPSTALSLALAEAEDHMGASRRALRRLDELGPEGAEAAALMRHRLGLETALPASSSAATRAAFGDEDALDYLIEELDEQDQRDRLGLAFADRALRHARCGRSQRARGDWLRAEDALNSHTNRRMALRTTLRLVRVAASLGRNEQAVELARACRRGFEQLDAGGHAARACVELFWLLDGEVLQARTALDLATRAEDDAAAALAGEALGQALLESDPDSARRHLSEARAHLRGDLRVAAEQALARLEGQAWTGAAIQDPLVSARRG
jgi:DNA-binding winged helix-turn-helix (wHTH) protein